MQIDYRVIIIWCWICSNKCNIFHFCKACNNGKAIGFNQYIMKNHINVYLLWVHQEWLWIQCLWLRHCHKKWDSKWIYYYYLLGVSIATKPTRWWLVTTNPLAGNKFGAAGIGWTCEVESFNFVLYDGIFNDCNWSYYDII